MMLDRLFDWDPRKAASNKSKHRVDFEEAKSVFTDAEALLRDDPDHSTGAEERWLLLGRSSRKRLLVVVYCERKGGIRIISTRKATKQERVDYEKRL